MNWQRDRSKIIRYGPERLKTFHVIMYEWIDNLCFTIDPRESLNNAEEYIAIAAEMFLEAGWHGDGAIELMWIPPFMFKGDRTQEFTVGVTVWHVKQRSDGFSWILTPVELPCQTEF